MGSRDHSYDCDICGFARGGLNDLMCMCDAWKEAAACALLTLASNLAVGAALCRAWDLGHRDGYDRACIEEGVNPLHNDFWLPGCGRSAP